MIIVVFEEKEIPAPPVKNEPPPDAEGSCARCGELEICGNVEGVGLVCFACFVCGGAKL